MGIFDSAEKRQLTTETQRTLSRKLSFRIKTAHFACQKVNFLRVHLKSPCSPCLRGEMLSFFSRAILDLGGHS